jgi:hypothetical protein
MKWLPCLVTTWRVSKNEAARENVCIQREFCGTQLIQFRRRLLDLSEAKQRKAKSWHHSLQPWLKRLENQRADRRACNLCFLTICQPIWMVIYTAFVSTCAHYCSYNDNHSFLSSLVSLMWSQCGGRKNTVFGPFKLIETKYIFG